MSLGLPYCLALSIAAVALGAEVHFPDPILDNHLRSLLSVQDDEQISKERLKTITKLQISDPFTGKVSNLEGLQFATNLTEIEILNGMVTDLSPLAELVELKKVRISPSRISDLRPLSGLKNLAQLNLDDNRIVDLTPLSALSNLTILSLEANQIKEIAPLSTLKNLFQLSLRDNQIGDLSALASLTGLWILGLANNLITDLDPLSEMHDLSWLALSGNLVDDIQPLANLRRVRELWLNSNQISNLDALSEFGRLSALDLSDNEISDITPISKLEALEKIDLSSNSIDDLGLLAGLVGLSHLTLREAQARDLSWLSALTNLQTIDVSGNLIRDIGSISGLKKLKKLDLSRNRISDLDPLISLPKLEYLDIDRNSLDIFPGTEAGMIYDDLEKRGVDIRHERFIDKPIRLLYIRAAFDELPNEMDSAEHVENVLQKTNQFMRKSSWGSFYLHEWDVTPVLRMKNAFKKYLSADELDFDFDSLLSDGSDLAILNGFPVSRYDFYAVQYNTELPGDHGGLLGGKARKGRPGIVLSATIAASTFIHELGHNLGACHSGRWDSQDGRGISSNGEFVEYGDWFDEMGEGAENGGGQFNTYWKTQFSWLDPEGSVETIDGDETYRLWAHNVGEETYNTERIYALRISTNADPDYWVEYRYSEASESKNEAVEIRLSPGWQQYLGANEFRDDGDTLLINPFGVSARENWRLSIGESFTDELSGVYIRPEKIGVSGDGAPWIDVRVEGRGVSLARWVKTNFNDFRQIDAASDPGGFGLPILARYAFGLDPFRPVRDGLPKAELVFGAGNPEGRLEVSFNRRIGASDVMFEIMVSEDLVEWESSNEIKFVDAIPVNAEIERAIYRDALPLTQMNVRFVRVEVSILSERKPLVE